MELVAWQQNIYYKQSCFSNFVCHQLNTMLEAPISHPEEGLLSVKIDTPRGSERWWKSPDIIKGIVVGLVGAFALAESNLFFSTNLFETGIRNSPQNPLYAVSCATIVYLILGAECAALGGMVGAMHEDSKFKK